MNAQDPGTVQRDLSAAAALLQAGRATRARRLLEKLLKTDPQNAEAHELRAHVALHQRDGEALRRHLQHAADLSPDHAERQVSFGLFMLRGGMVDEAMPYLARASALDTDRGVYHLYHGVACIAARDERGAELALSRLLFVQPEILTHPNPEASQTFVLQFIRLARQFMQGRYTRAVQKVMDPLLSHHGAEALARLTAAFDGMLGKAPYPETAPMQEPKLLRFPGLGARPFHDRSVVPGLDALEQRHEEIAAEYLALFSGGAEDPRKPYFAADGKPPALKHGYQTNLVGSRDWSAFHLWLFGRLDEGCARCPVTAASVEVLPTLAHAEHYMPEVFFSVLKAGAHIPPHHGLSNMRLAVHLPLLVPPDCAIRVGDETRAWQPGECLVFDDSYEHEAWNRSGEDRVVLIFEVWHPDLSPPEIEGLQAFFAARARFLREGGTITGD